MRRDALPLMWRLLVVGGAAIAALAIAMGRPAPARAADATATVKGGTLLVRDDDSAGNILIGLFGGAVEVDLDGDGTPDQSFDPAQFTRVVVRGGGGDDTIRVFPGISGEEVIVEGGQGDDMLFGGNGPETLRGGGGADVIDGNQGADIVEGGSGNDSLVWDPGDGSDVLEGGSGRDTMVFNGSNAAEMFDVSANGARVRFARNVGNIVMDLDDVERIDLSTLGSADRVTVNDLTGTDLADVDVDLTAVGGGGDQAADEVVVNGTAGDDDLVVSGASDGVVVTGGRAAVHVTGSDPTLDGVTVDGAAGTDTVTARLGAAGPFVITAVGTGGDTAVFEGTDGADEIPLVTNGPELLVIEQSTARFRVFAPVLLVKAGNGPDRVTMVGNVAAIPVAITVEGGRGDDILFGGNGAELLVGGDGADVIDGQQGNDTLLGGSGNDSLVWDPGDGSDVLEGGPGRDTMVFNGSNAAEMFDVSANGSRVRFTRNVGNIVMDVDDVERIDLSTLGSADTVTVNDVTGTDLADVDVDLTAVGGGGDQAADEVVVNGTTGDDELVVSGVPGGVAVTGGRAAVQVTGADSTLDEVTVNGASGTDTVTARLGAAGPLMINAVGTGSDVAVFEGTDGADEIPLVTNGPELLVIEQSTARFQALAPTLLVKAGNGPDRVTMVGNVAAFPVAITVEGGRGDDSLFGGNGAELLVGGDGNDVIDGQQGNDTLLGGSGNDTLVWDPGDGSDVAEGGSGRDTLAFNGSNAAEMFDVSANGSRVRFTRNVGNIVMDVDDLERIDLSTLGSADTVTVNDLAGTDLSDVEVDLAVAGGGGDSTVDQVVVNGTPGDDSFRVDVSGGGVLVKGPTARVLVTGADPVLDLLSIKTLTGFDVVKVADVVAALIQVAVDLGPQ